MTIVRINCGLSNIYLIDNVIFTEDQMDILYKTFFNPKVVADFKKQLLIEGHAEIVKDDDEPVPF